MTDFKGFGREALGWLRDLPSYDEARYGRAKAQLGAGLRKPAAALIAAVAEAVPRDLRVDARSAVSPLHRDLRFAPAGTPRYKDHLLMTCYQGDDRKRAPTLWIRIDGTSAGYASGMALDASARGRFREAVASPGGEALQGAIDALNKGRKGVDVAGADLKRVPKPWSEDHPRAQLLRVTGAFQVRYSEPLPAGATGPKFVDHCVRALTRLLPVHDFLVALGAP